MTPTTQKVLLKAIEMALSFLEESPECLDKEDKHKMNKVLASINKSKKKLMKIPTVKVGDLKLHEVHKLFDLHTDDTEPFDWRKAAFEGYDIYMQKGEGTLDHVGK